MHAKNPQPDPLLRYIKDGWQQLRRSVRQLPEAARDPKLGVEHERWPVYVSPHEDIEVVHERLQQQLAPEAFASLDLRRLPPDSGQLREHGLLYLPHDYVVPGGRFNEQYGWDSFWIVLGLLRDGELELAQHMVDNFLYEIAHYGTILNANRTYYLSRSHPPFLTAMLLAVYRRTGDLEWLRAAFPAVEAHYQSWVAPPHLTPETGLSRYYDRGSGPAPEVLGDEFDAEGRTHYDRLRAFFRANPPASYEYGYDLALFYDAARDELTPLCYVADRSMRESGFDPSDRFGRFNLGVIHSNPVCLNTLLFLMERESAEILAIVGDGAAATVWEERAARRRDIINGLLWDDEAGLYFDYDVATGRRRAYPFATTFYPLWAGVASPAQARRVANNLALFEAPGGLLTSTNVSGSQWDAPFGWAPLQMIAVKGLRRYGYADEANRIARAFIGLVRDEFNANGAIYEKYDVVNRSIDTSMGQQFGYSYNVIGFGWTNGTVLELLADLPA